MNVLLICGNDHKYGSAQAAINLLKYTKENCPDLRYIVLTQTQGGINELCEELNIENYVTGHAYSVVALDGSKLKRTVKRLVKTVYVAAKNTRALEKIDRLVNMKEVDLIHTNIDRDIIGCYLAEKYKLPHVMHLREFATGHYNVVPIYESQYKWYNKYVDKYIAISKAVGANWQEMELDPAKIEVVYDGIDVSKMQPRESVAEDPAAGTTAAAESAPEAAEAAPKALAAEAAPLKLVMCGDVSSLKGQDQTIRAMAAIEDEHIRNNITLDIYGEVHREKNYKEELEKIIKEAGIEANVNFRGYSTELATELRNYNCGVVCTKREGFGLATAEFMAAGLCVIASDTGANQELVEEGVNGLIYKYKDTADLAQKITKLYREPQLVDEYARNAMRIVREKFSIEANCKGILDIYQSVCKEDHNA